MWTALPLLGTPSGPVRPRLDTLSWSTRQGVVPCFARVGTSLTASS